MSEPRLNECIVIKQRHKQLSRLESFLDVIYALLFFQMLQYLPQAEDMKWVGQPFGLLQPLLDNPVELLRIIIGIGLVIIYWNLSSRLLSFLYITDGLHSLLVILQMLFVCFFIYFAISDPQIAGGPSSPALQSSCLAISGFIGTGGWIYACRSNFVEDNISIVSRNMIMRKNLVEPITALLNIPMAFVSPLAWTFGWIFIPMVITPFLRTFRKKYKTKKS